MKYRLIELIQNAVGGCSRHWAGLIADALIANGVTFATDNNVGKWIPVSERLPEFYMNEDGCYCTHRKLVFRSSWDKTVHIGYCIKLIYIISIETLETIETLEWYDDHGNKWENVSHWLPLPEPPEEE